MKLKVERIESPVGTFWAASNSTRICSLGFSEGEKRLRAGLVRRFGSVEFLEDEGVSELRLALGAYFSGKWDSLGELPLNLGGTAFQLRVWEQLRLIPVGETRSYKNIAQELDCEGGERAVGGANGANPVALLVPCHRVIAHDGKLGGYGWGIARKEWFLHHEGSCVGEVERGR